MMQNAELIVTADDFGLSPAINKAITDLYKKKAITRASLLINNRFTSDALSLMRRKCPDMPVGIHLSLTCGRCCSDPEDIPLLSDVSGNMKLTYGKLLYLTLNPVTRKRILRQIETEFESQIETLRRKRIRISHMDGHQHVHMIPGIYPIAVKLADKNAISDIRIVNERFFLTKSLLRRGVRIGGAGVVKFMILKMFCILAMAGRGRYFFSILQSCSIRPGMINFDQFIKLGNRFDVVELMLHPGDADYDRAYSDMIDPREIQQALSMLRREEYAAALEIKKEIKRRSR